MGVPEASIAELTAANRAHPDPDRERELVRLRLDVGQQLKPDADPPPIVEPAAPAPSPAPLTVGADGLSAALVRAGILRDGCVHVRGLVPPATVEALREGIDRAFATADAEDRSPWYDPQLKGPTYGFRRKWTRDAGGIWAADSPRMLSTVLDALEDVGLLALVSEYLGERPVLSVNKCVLRRVPADLGQGSDWHQDGAFLGEATRSLNVWLALSECGIDAPGLDIVPRRLDEVAPTGTAGANFDWSVAPSVVEEVAAGVPITRPMFGAGDVLLFDHLFLHRTAVDAGMTRPRYAVESWLFAPSAYPRDQVPLAW